MKKIREQAEVLQISIYTNIVCDLLKKHNRLSICKLVTFSYIVKQSVFMGGPIYTAHNKRDVIYKGISILSGDFERYCDSLVYIFKAIHLLISQNVIVMENNFLFLSDINMSIDTVYPIGNFLNKVIIESRNMSDKQFMKEVTYNV